MVTVACVLIRVYKTKLPMGLVLGFRGRAFTKNPKPHTPWKLAASNVCCWYRTEQQIHVAVMPVKHMLVWLSCQFVCMCAMRACT